MSDETAQDQSTEQINTNQADVTAPTESASIPDQDEPEQPPAEA
jgi:hypothetical protein